MGSATAKGKDMQMLYRSLISGFLSYLSVSLPRVLPERYAISDDVLFLFPGLLFGVFILVPLKMYAPPSGIRRAIVLVCSATAWYIAVAIGLQALPLAAQSPAIACGLSGSVGVAILAGTSRLIVPVHIPFRAVLIALLVGFLGGGLIGLAVAQPRASLSGEGLYLLGFIFWQTSVAHALFREAATLSKKR